MSDHLFPDAVPIDTKVRVRSGARRGFGIASFVLGLVAVLGDLIVGGLILTALPGIASPAADEAAIGFAFAVLLGSIVAFWGGIVLAVLALVFGIIALVRGHGRVLAISGMVLAVITLVVNVTVGAQLIFGFDQITNFTGQLT